MEEQIIGNYDEEIDKIRRKGRECGLSDDEIEFAYQQSLKLVQNSQTIRESISSPIRWLKSLIYVFLFLSVCYCITLHKPVNNFIERNIQEAIYPVMKIYRRMTLPLVQYFPRITELYDESCLVENPYFKVANMECWPCEHARVVLNMTDSIANSHVGLPFFIKISDGRISLAEIRDVYLTYSHVVRKNAERIQSNIGFSKISQLLDTNVDLSVDHPSAHIVWRINRMEVGRVLRSLLKPPRSSETPSHATAIGIERFLLIDGPSSPHYVVPSPEGANVFIKQLSGQRLIVLEPAPECRNTCRRLSFFLNEQHMLWYNWWYWRPRSLPVHNSSTVSVSFMGSTT